MTPEMAGSDIALGRKTTVIENIVSEEWWGRRARIADEDPKELLYEECLRDACQAQSARRPAARGDDCPPPREADARRARRL